MYDCNAGITSVGLVMAGISGGLSSGGGFYATQDANLILALLQYFISPGNFSYAVFCCERIRSQSTSVVGQFIGMGTCVTENHRRDPVNFLCFGEYLPFLPIPINWSTTEVLWLLVCSQQNTTSTKCHRGCKIHLLASVVVYFLHG